VSWLAARDPHSKDPDLTYMGEAVGRWEGDTLVTDTIGLRPLVLIATSWPDILLISCNDDSLLSRSCHLRLDHAADQKVEGQERDTTIH
jgi:hypothetical protein